MSIGTVSCVGLECLKNYRKCCVTGEHITGGEVVEDKVREVRKIPAGKDQP